MLGNSAEREAGRNSSLHEILRTKETSQGTTTQHINKPLAWDFCFLRRLSKAGPLGLRKSNFMQLEMESYQESL